VETESQWTARNRELAGIFPKVRVRPPAEPLAQADFGRATLRPRVPVYFFPRMAFMLLTMSLIESF
jgi:hypothetical protein